MKVLQVNCVYKRGSTGKIVADIHKVLIEQGIESVVCYGRQRGFVPTESYVYKICKEIEGDIHNFAHRYLGSLQYGGCYFPTKRLIAIIKAEKPDIVHLQCINGFCVNIYKLLKWLGESKIKTVVTNHAEFYYTGSCGHAYDCVKWQQIPGCGKCPILKEATGSRNIDNTSKAWRRMRRAFTFFDSCNIIFTAVSPWVKSRFLLSPITNQFKCEVVENGVAIDTFNRKDKDACDALRSSMGIPIDCKIVFHATASFTLSEKSLKGGRFIFELAKRMPNVYFVVAALLSEEIENCPQNLILIGRAKTQEDLAVLYSTANVTLITSRRETFSMVTAESLCCGTPLIGFKAGGPESIALPEYSTFVEYGDLDALQENLQAMLVVAFDNHYICAEAAKKYSAVGMTDKYVHTYNELLRN